MSGAQLKYVLEDVADNLFNPGPLLPAGGDMVRTGGMRFDCRPGSQIRQADQCDEALQRQGLSSRKTI